MKDLAFNCNDKRNWTIGVYDTEQAAIEAFATNAEQSKLEHPSSNVFG
ncbi:MAG: hypothetical protein ACRD8Z_16960 [Nitrososphaeraceae archaeon]